MSWTSTQPFLHSTNQRIKFLNKMNYVELIQGRTSYCKHACSDCEFIKSQFTKLLAIYTQSITVDSSVNTSVHHQHCSENPPTQADCMCFNTSTIVIGFTLYCTHLHCSVICFSFLSVLGVQIISFNSLHSGRTSAIARNHCGTWQVPAGGRSLCVN